jgi:hypothetical protein
VSADDFISILGGKLNIVGVKTFSVENDDWYILKIIQ